MPVTEDHIRVHELSPRVWCIKYGGVYHMDYENMGRCRAVREYLQWLNRQLGNAELEQELGDLYWDLDDEEEEDF